MRKVFLDINTNKFKGSRTKNYIEYISKSIVETVNTLDNQISEYIEEMGNDKVGEALMKVGSLGVDFKDYFRRQGASLSLVLLNKIKNYVLITYASLGDSFIMSIEFSDNTYIASIVSDVMNVNNEPWLLRFIHHLKRLSINHANVLVCERNNNCRIRGTVSQTHCFGFYHLKASCREEYVQAKPEIKHLYLNLEKHKSINIRYYVIANSWLYQAVGLNQVVIIFKEYTEGSGVLPQLDLTTYFKQRIRDLLCRRDECDEDTQIKIRKMSFVIIDIHEFIKRNVG